MNQNYSVLKKILIAMFFILVLFLTVYATSNVDGLVKNNSVMYKYPYLYNNKNVMVAYESF